LTVDRPARIRANSRQGVGVEPATGAMGRREIIQRGLGRDMDDEDVRRLM
jgi:hypothetical protein